LGHQAGRIWSSQEQARQGSKPCKEDAVPRKRRRVFKESDSPNYDRTADRPDFVSAFPDDDEAADATRSVELDEEQADSGTPNRASEEFWAEQRPPHHGA
jgi:hypothetical protein